MPEDYQVDCSIIVSADSKIEAFDKIRDMLSNVADINLTTEVSNELFEELGVLND